MTHFLAFADSLTAAYLALSVGVVAVVAIALFRPKSAQGIASRRRLIAFSLAVASLAGVTVYRLWKLESRAAPQYQVYSPGGQLHVPRLRSDADYGRGFRAPTEVPTPSIFEYKLHPDTPTK